MLVITAYFDDLDMDVLTSENADSIAVVIEGVSYKPDMTSSIGSE